MYECMCIHKKNSAVHDSTVSQTMHTVQEKNENCEFMLQNIW